MRPNAWQVECIFTGPQVPTPPPEEDFHLDMDSVLAHVRSHGGPRRRARPVCVTPAKIMPEDVGDDGASGQSGYWPSCNCVPLAQLPALPGTHKNVSLLACGCRDQTFR